jgi:predicted AAA+ superfamily ATPase
LKELKGVIRFMEQFNPKYGIVVTKDLLKMQDNIFFIPAWLFLVIFG